MTATPITIASDRVSRLILLAALILGAIYLLDDFGIGAPYPLNVIIKVSACWPDRPVMLSSPWSQPSRRSAFSPSPSGI